MYCGEQNYKRSLSSVIPRPSIESKRHRCGRRAGRRTIGLDFKVLVYKFFSIHVRSGEGKRKKKERDSKSRGTRLLFQRRCVCIYIYVRIHLRYDPASMTGHCIRGIRAERLLHAGEYAFTRRQTPVFGFSSTALAEIHRIYTHTADLRGTRIYANFIAFRGW